MDSAGEVLQQVLPVYLLMVAGAVLRRLGMTKRENDEGILHLVFHVMYPCFILDKILGSASVRDLSAVSWGIGLGFLFPLIGFAIAWWVGGLLGYSKGEGRRTFTVSAGLQNFGYTAIPVVAQIWAGTGAMAMLFVHNLGVELALWSVGMMIISGDRKVPWRRLLNGPMIAVTMGLVLVALGLDTKVTGPPRQAMHWLGAGAFPVAIFVAGAVMMDLLGKVRPTLRASFGGSLLRLGLIPLVMLLLARFLPAPLVLKQVLVVQAAMPAAITPILLARLYGGRPAVAVEVVVATTLLSLITLPLILVWGRALVGI